MNESRGRGRELLHDPGDVEGDDVEAAGGAVEHAQVEQIAEVQLVVGDRLLGDEDPVGRARAAGRASARRLRRGSRSRAGSWRA